MYPYIISKLIEEGIEAVKKVYFSRARKEIDLIIEDQFRSYRGIYACLKPAHDELRKLLGDVKFLEYLKQGKLISRKPVYKISDEMKNFINESSRKY